MACIRRPDPAPRLTALSQQELEAHPYEQPGDRDPQGDRSGLSIAEQVAVADTNRTINLDQAAVSSEVLLQDLELSGCRLRLPAVIA